MASGFQPQKEILYNKLLPYQDRIEDDATTLLAEIKYNLGRAVLFQELTPGALVWCNRLTIYLRMYGRNFSKEDHILFVKLLYELVAIENLEPQFVRGFCHALIQLLKKRDLISRDDLVLSWRPLYKLLHSIKFSKTKSLGLQRFPPKFAETVQHLARFARVYFSSDATMEMLEEWRPLLCPFDTIMGQGIYYFSNFLPTCLLVKEHNSGFRLWFEELMDFWLNCTQHVPESQEDLMKLFARLAEENVGYIDWTPYLPKIFNRFLSGLHLPIGKSKPAYGGSFELLAVGTMARWIVFMINSANQGFDLLRTLFKALESFYHPSNYGRHSHRLLKFLCQLTENFIKRIHRERYREPSWCSTIPEEAKLKDDDIDKFVGILKPVAMLAVYSKTGSFDAASTLQNLASLRPDMIVPPLLDRTFEALEAILEPHQVVATLSCITSVARSLVFSGENFNSGQLHIVTLLRLALPGIDANDFRKSMATFTLISSVVSLVPLVDCSEALTMGIEMTEHERELCAISAHFEDFVLEFLDRCFGLIDNSAIEQTTQQDNLLIVNMDTQEGMIGMGLASTLHTVLIQSSPKIFMTALQRLFNYCEFRVLEVAVAGKMVSDMARAAVKAYPSATLKKFIPHCCLIIKNVTSVDGIKEEENVDTELLWNLEILSEIVRCSGKELLPYITMLEEVVASSIHLKCKKAYARAAKILKGILTFLTQTYPCEWRSLPITFNLPLNEHLYVRDWGKLGDIKNLEMNWHIPSHEELQVADKLLMRFLNPEMEKLEECMKGKAFTREEIHQSLYVFISCVCGASALMKTWCDDSKVTVIGPATMVTRDRRFHATTVLANDGIYSRITRKEIALLLHRFLEHMLSKQEDDTKTLNLIAKGYYYLILYHGVSRDEFDMRWTSTSAVKKTLEDKLHKKNMHPRAILIERVQLQHDMRLLERQSSRLTEMDKIVIDDLLKLSTSVYTEIRIKTQKMLFSCFDIFDYSARSILPAVLDKLRDDPSISHEEFKGSLNVLLNSRMLYLATHYWEAMVDTWPKIIEADHSEKPSMVKLIDKLVDTLFSKMDSVGIRRQISDSCVQAALDILESSNPRPIPNARTAGAVDVSTSVVPSEELLKHAEEVAETKNQNNLRLYNKLVDQLVGKIEANNLRWRHTQICVNLLTLLIRYDQRLPAKAVGVFVQLLGHDALAMRKKSIKALAAILLQQKQPRKKVAVNLQSKGLDTTKDSLLSLPPGNRPDNEWVTHRRALSPKTEEEWNKMQFVDKTHNGYYTWPTTLYTYASINDQPSVNNANKELPKEEKVIFDAFQNEEYVAKITSFLSIEEKKGKDTFSGNRFSLFLGIFRNLGSSILPIFKPIIEKLLADNQESSHRCASEIISGLIRGSKHWEFSKLQDLWAFLIPLLKKTFANIIPEVLHDWATALVTATENRDPYRYTDLFEFLLDNPISGDGGAFGDAGRLFLAQSTIVQQEWRTTELNHKLFNYLIPHLAHPYKNVRDRIGSVYSYILMFDVSFGKCTPTISPKVSDLCEKIIEEIEVLNGSELQHVADATTEDVEMKSEENSQLRVHNSTSSDVEMADLSVEEERRKRAIRVAKTVFTFLSSQRYTMQPASEETFRLLPYLMPLESREDDPELQDYCKCVFRRLPEIQLKDHIIPIAISTLSKISGHRSWNVRRLVLQYIQVMIFHNLFTLKATEFLEEICRLVLHALEDEQLEVRLEASKTSSGLVHYGYVLVDDALQARFSIMAKTKLPKKQKAAEDANLVASALRARHAGILGMSACILAFPYEVPDWLPQMLIEVGDHLHDSTFIQATVKKTLSEFRRTHHDNWQEHKLKFKDDQLAVLTDLLVSPNYYA